MSARLGWWVMIAVMTLLAGRTVLAARSAAISNFRESKNAARVGSDPLLTAVDRQDSLLTVASLSSRDPFRAWTPSGPVSAPRTSTAASVPAPVVPPRIAVLMDTGSSVIIEIEVNGETSPRLPVGGSFRGWTIAGVSESSVTFIKDGKRFTVPRP